MTDILQAITQHLQEQYPQLHIAHIKIPHDNAITFSEYAKLTPPPSPRQPYPPHNYIYYCDGTLTILNEHLQDTHIELANPDSITHIHDTIQKLLTPQKLP